MLGFLEQLDHRLFFLINNGLGCEPLDDVFGDLSTMGGWTIAIVALAFIAYTGRRVFWRHFIVLLLVVLCFSTINRALKKTFRRQRPARAFQEQIAEGTVEVRIVGPTLKRKAMPSGHSMTAFLFMSYIAFCYRAFRPWAFLLASVVAFSRIYVGAHFPADCVAGAGVGTLGGWVGSLAFRRWNGRAEGNADKESETT